MSWRLAKSLEQLRSQINAAFPGRSKVSDGTVGDLAHRNRASDHNPNAQGVVTAMDITNDPPNGVNGRELSDQLITDSRVKYVIFAGQIWKAKTGKWEAYRGPNSHHHHVHLSVKPESIDDVSPWPLDKAPIKFPTNPTLRRGDKGQFVSLLQTKLGIDVDGNFGFGTERAVKRFQVANGLDDDGVVGPATWRELKV